MLLLSEKFRNNAPLSEEKKFRWNKFIYYHNVSKNFLFYYDKLNYFLQVSRFALAPKSLPFASEMAWFGDSFLATLVFGRHLCSSTNMFLPKRHDVQTPQISRQGSITLALSRLDTEAELRLAEGQISFSNRMQVWVLARTWGKNEIFKIILLIVCLP